MTSQAKLKPCPFCDETEIKMLISKTETGVQIFCPSCGVKCGRVDFFGLAIKVWNEAPRKKK